MTALPVTFAEHDESGCLVAAYGNTSRQDIGEKEKRTFLQQLINIFLPAGFPLSVTDDYVGYQIYDSLQAFSSAIASILTSRAILEGYGVGDANASATTALLLSILQDSVGRIATILFAYDFGPALEAECKKYRFLADIFNDAGMVLSCVTPSLPPFFKVTLLCLSGTLRALCGVAAGSSKASLSVHFAKSGNVGELNAKDSSQETVISLLGMLAGSFVVRIITSTEASWVAVVVLLAIHLVTNYKAVRCVEMRTLNRHRANILFSTYRDSGIVLTPRELSCRERILERDGVLRWGSLGVLGHARVGVKFSAVLAAAGGSGITVDGFAEMFSAQKYILWPSMTRNWVGYRRLMIHISLLKGATTEDQLKAWFHALILSRALALDPEANLGTAEKQVLAAMVEADSCFAHAAKLFSAKGWDLHTACIETTSGFRIALMTGDGVITGYEKESKKVV